MMNHNALSRPRSDYGDSKNRLEFFKHTDAFVRINLISPALSIWGKSIDRNNQDEKDNDRFDILSGWLSDSLNPDIFRKSEINQNQFGYRPTEVAIDLISDNVSWKSESNNENIEVKMNDLDFLGPNITNESYE